MEQIVKKYKNIDGMYEVGKKAMELPIISNRWFDINKQDIETILKQMTGKSAGNLALPSIVMIFLSVVFILNV